MTSTGKNVPEGFNHFCGWQLKTCPSFHTCLTACFCSPCVYDYAYDKRKVPDTCCGYCHVSFFCFMMQFCEWVLPIFGVMIRRKENQTTGKAVCYEICCPCITCAPCRMVEYLEDQPLVKKEETDPLMMDF